MKVFAILSLLAHAEGTDPLSGCISNQCSRTAGGKKPTGGMKPTKGLNGKFVKELAKNAKYDKKSSNYKCAVKGGKIPCCYDFKRNVDAKKCESLCTNHKDDCYGYSHNSRDECFMWKDHGLSTKEFQPEESGWNCMIRRHR